MAINKVIDRNNNVLIDLTNDTVKPENVLSGVSFHDNKGNLCTGTLSNIPSTSLDKKKYNFIDYDGTLLYSFTDDELDALTELPAGRDHLDENLKFEKWNWSLEDLKNWRRTRPDRPIVGANVITNDGNTYYLIDYPYEKETKLQVSIAGISSIDWGDGNIEDVGSYTGMNHTFTKGKYIVKFVTNPNAAKVEVRVQTYYNHPISYSIKEIRFGKITKFGSYAIYNSPYLKKINVPASVTSIESDNFSYTSIGAIVVPEGVTSLSSYGNVQNLENAKTLSLPKYLTTVGIGKGIENIVIPDGCHIFKFYRTTFLKEVYIPAPGDNYKNSAINFDNCQGLMKVQLDDNLEKFPTFAGYSPLEVNIPKNLKSFSGETFSVMYNLRLDIPDGVTSLPVGMFRAVNNFEVIVPDSVTEIKNGWFSTSSSSYCGIIDLTKVTKVIPLTGSIGNFSTSYNIIIKVPLSLLSQYKSASYWANYADVMIGV